MTPARSGEQAGNGIKGLPVALKNKYAIRPYYGTGLHLRHLFYGLQA